MNCVIAVLLLGQHVGDLGQTVDVGRQAVAVVGDEALTTVSAVARLASAAPRSLRSLGELAADLCEVAR